LKYSQILIKLIQDYNLENYSLIALGKLPAEQSPEISVIDSTQLKPAQASFYPEGPFSINAAKVVFAKAGVSLLSLSYQYEIPLARLLEFNDMNQQDVLKEDQLVFLQRKRKYGELPFHIVQPGESIYSICQSEGVRFENILEYNRLKPGEEPAAGEKIYLQTMSDSKPSLKRTESVKTGPPSS
jgi:hypothetical protein